MLLRHIRTVARHIPSLDAGVEEEKRLPHPDAAPFAASGWEHHTLKTNQKSGADPQNVILSEVRHEHANDARSRRIPTLYFDVSIAPDSAETLILDKNLFPTRERVIR